MAAAAAVVVAAAAAAAAAAVVVVVVLVLLLEEEDDDADVNSYCQYTSHDQLCGIINKEIYLRYLPIYIFIRV
jgi:hypothetical protein